MPCNIATYVTAYCVNCSLAGVGYIVNKKLHLTERLFWLICITVSTLGSWHLIRQYRNEFESKAISMVTESIHPKENTQFPSVGVCELGFPRQQYQQLEDLVESFRNGSDDIEYSFDVEDYLLRLVFQNIYTFGSLGPYCTSNDDCTSCVQCPTGNYKKYSEMIRTNCSDLFVSCKWNRKPFDCCTYFLPMQTSMGKCFLLNSIHTTTVGSIHWLNTEIGWDVGNGHLEIVVINSVAVHILNAEDVPHLTLTSLQDVLPNTGYQRYLQLQLQNIVNDPDVREVSPSFRKCRFHDELLPNFAYKHYSFSTCVTDCLKRAQIQECNCTNYNLIVSEQDKSPSCDLKGFLCLDSKDLLYPKTTIMQPWRSKGVVCKCLPSCDEHEIRIIEKSFVVNPATTNRNVTITIQSLPTERYRRQAVRTRLDVVVTIGGILGLFMGASILSGIELLYFFTLRICGNKWK